MREQLKAAQWDVRNWEAASEGERKVAAKLHVLTRRGWRLLLDRRWPGTRAANVDMLLVGPGGVFVIDVKNWRHAPEAVDGHLTAGGRTYDREIGKLLKVTRLAENAVSARNLSPVAVQPLMVFAGRSLDAALGTVRLLGEREVTPALIAERTRLRPSEVKAIADHLERTFPAYEDTSARTGPAAPASPVPAPDDALFDVEGIRNAAVEAARSAPIEQWMTFLHPDQLALVRRDWSGPARVSGPAGTGKTVVALHRAAHLARRTSGRILYVTFANNLPRVQGTFLKAMAPAVADRIDFRSLHAWAGQFLRDRGVATRLDHDKSVDAFSRAWQSHGRRTVLETLDPAPGYWQEEIDYVIKGRGITSFEQYAPPLRRERRRTVLRRTHREAVWALYQEYERNRTAKGVHDFNDILALALAEALAHPGATPYTSVIVDEVQDLTFVGVRLLHALVGDAANGLLLVGDGQQAVYPGGFRLSDAGIDVRGRGQVLRANYRNAKEILDAALAVVADDAFDDIDGTPTAGRRDVDLTYGDGGRVTRCTAPTRTEHDEALLTALRALGPEAWPDSAVLCRTGAERERYRRLLTRAGIPAVTLEQYDGRPVPGVKLGSYHRAKGLEFKHVHLPDHDAPATAAPGDGTDDGVARERRELHRSQLFVAMTRARDTLWLGSFGRP
ncbi:UvrD-helicase domain-containing protein [Streptomyces sp. HU2014]|uniref:nuclease-related domain-containing DEAD/DEAH box helicase n=1 Tax=Streptomyces sp. HU2014 TaxID=2939414 RepID=UPI00200DCA6C|nr:UvrD-helicase domain-containing protein [Streptomyces sp. HU2014]UQI46342.1 UvrD-helicase domain-containing protein [Streptomyces sp. HU2014]